MTRRTRRRLVVLAAAAATGAAAPAWAPALLREVDAFRVHSVRVEGTRFVDPAEVRALAALGPEASVWDDSRAWEDRVRGHPLVRDVTVRRTGLRTLRFVIEEARPVALAALPRLRPVDADGRLLPIDPARHALDLPILLSGVEADGAVSGEEMGEAERLATEAERRACAVLAELSRHDPEFLSRVSEVVPLPTGGLELRLMGDDLERLRLPSRDPVRGLMRTGAALLELEPGRRAVSADARFRDQVVVQLREDA